MNYMETLKKRDLIFRKPTLNDVDELFRLKNNEKAAYLLGGIFSDYTYEDIRNWIDFHNNNGKETLFVIYDNSMGKLIGHVGLYKIDTVAKKAEDGILIADDNSRGKGYGTLCTSVMVAYAFDTLNLHKVTAEVLSENIASASMFKKCGFKVDGLLRDDCFKNGRYYDVLVMSVLDTERQ